MATDDQKTRSVSDYERIGRLMAPIVEGGFISHKRLVGLSFVRGVFIGFGSVIGATVLIGILVWTLSFFNEVPFVQDLADKINQGIEASP